MSVRTRNILAFIANLTVFVATCICVAHFFITGGQGNMADAGWKAFRYFTIDSNVLAALGCLVGLSFNMASIITGEDCLPHWALLLRYAGTVAVTVTLAVTVGFLSLTYGFGPLFAGVSLFLHGVNPVLFIVTFMFLDKGLVRFRESWIPVVPVLAYGVVYVVEVVYIGVAAGGWSDFYAFNVGGMWYVAVLVIGVATYAFALIERLTHRWEPQAARRRAAARVEREEAEETAALARLRRTPEDRGEGLARGRRRRAAEVPESAPATPAEAAAEAFAEAEITLEP